jgi:hypothetical protein
MTKGRRIPAVGVKVQTVSTTSAPQAAAPASTPTPSALSLQPLYGVAMLKVAMELKKSPDVELDAVVRRVVSAMRLDESTFRQHLERNGGLLRGLQSKRPVL